MGTEETVKKLGCIGAAIALPFVALEGALYYGGNFAKRHKITTAAVILAGGVYLFNTNSCVKTRQYVKSTITDYIEDKARTEKETIRKELETTKEREQKLAQAYNTIRQDKTSIETKVNETNIRAQQTSEELAVTNKKLNDAEKEKSQYKTENERLKNQPPQIQIRTVEKPIYIQAPAQSVPTQSTAPSGPATYEGSHTRVVYSSGTLKQQTPRLPARQSYRVAQHNSPIPSTVEPHTIDENDGCYAHHIIQPGETLSAVAKAYYSNADNQTWRIIQKQSMQFENYFEDDRRIPVGSIAHIPK